MSCSTFIYKKNGDLLVFGDNEHGQLGLDDLKNRNTLTLLMNNINIKLIYHKYFHTIIYKSNDNLLVFGYNIYGQLNLKSEPMIYKYNHMNIDMNDDLFIFKSNRILQFDLDKTTNNMDNLNIKTLPILMNDKDIKIIFCGYHHSMIYKNDGDLLVFTTKEYKDKPILLMNNKQINMICCGKNHFLIYQNNGDLLVFGQNIFGQLGLGDDQNRYKLTLLMTNENIKFIHCGDYHSILYMNNEDLLVFGLNDFGQLGLGDDKDRWIPTLLMNDKEIKMISCGSRHSLIYKNNGDLFVFGNNYQGQLGLIQNENKIFVINRPTLLMNDPSIIKINNSSVLLEWSPINHKYFSNIFKMEILTLYKCLKHIQNIHGLKVPKFVIYEIIKIIDQLT